MTDTNVQRFRFAIPIVKTSVKFVKDKDGNEIEERYVEGVASGTELDKHGDRMAPSAIESMAKSLKQHVINLNVEHDTSWAGELGDIAELNVSDDNDLGIKAKLNEMSSANDLWYALTKQNKKLGLSIGGYVKDYEMVKEGKGDEAKWVRLYKKIDLDHIAVTSRPAYPKSWVSNIAKSIKDDDENLLKKVKSEDNLENEEKSRVSQKEKRIRELARSIARSIQKLESDLLLELCYKGLMFCNEEQILLLERSLEMTNKDVSLEAEDTKKKVKSEEPKSEGTEDKKSAAPEDEKSKDKSEGVKAEGADEKTAEEDKTSKAKSKPQSTKSEDKSEDADKGKKDDGEEADKSEDKEDEPSKVKSEEKTAKTDKADDKDELTEIVKGLSKDLKTVLTGYEALQKKVEELEVQPASRKTVEVKRTLGDEETEDKSVEELEKEMDKKIEKIKKTGSNNPNLFAEIQRVRADYSSRIQKAE
jgi:phage head maturation protease